MRKFYVIENNAGGIEMFVTNEDGNMFEGWFTDYEFNSELLLDDITEIINGGEYVNMWNNNFVYNFDSPEEANIEINRILDDFVNNTVIMEYDGGALTEYPHRMSSYAQEIFGWEVK